MTIVIHGPRFNRRVSCDSNPQNARSESDLAVNPLNPYNMVGSSKRFTDIVNYAFSLAAYATFDGGQTWTETVLPLVDTNGTSYPSTTDPAVIFDDIGNVYIVALPWQGETGPNHGQTIGISIYKSVDGGRTWGTPRLIHQSTVDDKQACWADTTGGPHSGNVYAAWDGSGGMLFARTTDHGATWKGTRIGGVDQPAGAVIAGTSDSFSPELTVMADGTLLIVWAPEGGSTIKLITSSDGGATFSAPITVASGITNLMGALSTIGGWPVFPGGTFRVITYACVTTSGTGVTVAWADMREQVSRIYYRFSPDGGKTWNGPSSGQPMFTGAQASAANMQDFHPQLATTPTGEVGVTFYEFGPMGGGEFPSDLIVVEMAASTDSGQTFASRITVSDQSWNPALDAPNADAIAGVTFIGDYYGFAASTLGFFPFWTDTRSGIQEMFIARVSIYPADLYTRDESGDTGSAPSPGAVFWESPDMVVRHQPDGDVNFVDQGLLRNGVTTHYVYGRATNNGPNDTSAATFAVTVGNFPSLLGLPGSEFWYPQDWYPDDWSTAALESNHLSLGESPPLAVANGATAIFGPIVWPAGQIPIEGTWHPCLLGEVRSGNDDSAGGVNGGDIPADPADMCPHGSFVYGNNNVCQRNLTYVHMAAGESKHVNLPFIAGSVWDPKHRTIDITVDKGRELAEVPMTLRMEPISLPGHGTGGGGGDDDDCCAPGELVFTGECRVIVRVGNCMAGEIVTTKGTVWRSYCPCKCHEESHDGKCTCHGKNKKEIAAGAIAKRVAAASVSRSWELKNRRTTVSFSVTAQELRKLTLSFVAPADLKKSTIVRIAQRKDGKIPTGGVSLQLLVGSEPKAPAASKVAAAGKRRKA